MNFREKKKQKIAELKSRVLASRERLIYIGVLTGLKDFKARYPKKYAPKNASAKERIKNLWYGKITDLEFTLKLEGFVKFKETQFED